MHDLNFFTLLKKQGQKSKVAKMIITSVLLLVLIINALLFGVGYFTFSKIEAKTRKNQEFIDSPLTKQKVKEAEIASKEAAIAREYLSIITDTANQINQLDLIKVDLVDYIRGLAPVATSFTTVEYSEAEINLECSSTNQLDPMYFYNRLLTDSRFARVVLPGFTVEANGMVNYTLLITLKGGDPK